jgi:adenosylhomocysteine nucleosidase
MSILIVTPLQQEFDALAGGLRDRGWRAEPRQPGRLPAQFFPELDLIMSRGGVGKAQYALQTQYLLERAKGVHLIICAGTAGALAESVAIGDIVVGSASVEFDYLAKFFPVPPPSFSGDEPTIRELLALPLAVLPFQVHIGPIASGDETILDRTRAEEVRARTEALANGWEGAGGARVAAFNELPYLELRGISDNADHTATADFPQNLARALDNLAALLDLWLRR